MEALKTLSLEWKAVSFGGSACFCIIIPCSLPYVIIHKTLASCLERVKIQVQFGSLALISLSVLLIAKSEPA